MKSTDFKKAHRFTTRWEKGSTGGPAFADRGRSFLLLQSHGALRHGREHGAGICGVGGEEGAGISRKLPLGRAARIRLPLLQRQAHGGGHLPSAPGALLRNRAGESASARLSAGVALPRGRAGRRSPFRPPPLKLPQVLSAGPVPRCCIRALRHPFRAPADSSVGPLRSRPASRRLRAFRAAAFRSIMKERGRGSAPTLFFRRSRAGRVPASSARPGSSASNPGPAPESVPAPHFDPHATLRPAPSPHTGGEAGLHFPLRPTCAVPAAPRCRALRRPRASAPGGSGTPGRC